MVSHMHNSLRSMNLIRTDGPSIAKIEESQRRDFRRVAVNGMMLEEIVGARPRVTFWLPPFREHSLTPVRLSP